MDALAPAHPIGQDFRPTQVEAMMPGTVEKKLADLGITLGTPAAPVANYVGFVRTGNLMVVSGQLCFGPEGKLVATGKLGGAVSIDDGQKAARACAINLLSHLKVALGDLDKVQRVVRLGGFINAMPDFLETPKVMNGASDLMVTAFGDKGRHARTPRSGWRFCRWMPRSKSRACLRCPEA
jgi:enamine deaminase RidA (YjgF/YER057c/UK114 family)